MTPDTVRYELKLLCPWYTLAQVRSWVRMHPAAFQTTYPPRTVNSLYLDTLELGSLQANLDGLSIRSKLRCRWYGVCLSSVQAQLEWKHKQNMLGAKQVVLLDQLLDVTRPWSEILAAIRNGLSSDPNASVWLHRLQTIHRPALLNRYRREYYATPEGDVRLTLDYDQAAYDQRLTYPYLNLTTSLPIEDAVVIEIKAGATQADRVDEIVDHFPLSRTRNSKYAKGMLVALYSQ
ncbi:MAG: polyphosphate polymerase domain-containing protein [Anaerolineae bacterium]